MKKLGAILLLLTIILGVYLTIFQDTIKTREPSSTSTPTVTLPPAVVAPALPATTTTTTFKPSGKYAAYESRFGTVIHDGLDLISPARAYTRCYPADGTAEIYVATTVKPEEKDGVIFHEYGHVLECRQGWGSDVNSPLGESVADAISIRLGGFATYGHYPNADVFSLADSLLSERTG